MKKYFQNKYKKSGVTLLELLIAIGISSIVIVSVLTTVGNIYFSQKKVRFSQNFYTESRILMERISQFARNNTIDYDRYFLEVGPDDTNIVSPAIAVCANFVKEQHKDTSSLVNNADNRAGAGDYIGGYPSIFYWDTDADGNGTQDRNLGGMNINGDADPCAQAFSETLGITNNKSQASLYLINGARTLRTAIRNKLINNAATPVRVEPFDQDNDNDIDDDDYLVLSVDTDESFRVEIQRQLGADTDNDLVADVWAPSESVTIDIDSDGGVETGEIRVHWDDVSSQCIIYVDDGANSGEYDVGESYVKILGDETSEDFCAKAHDWTSISPKLIKIDDLTFNPAPDRDPFLNFRVDEAQIHPHVFISLKTDVRDPSAHGFEAGNQPKLSFQTTVSSRVFGNTR